jgi:hypothetical protein
MQKIVHFHPNLDLNFLSPCDCFVKSSGKIKTQGWFLIGLSLPVCAPTDLADGDHFSFKLTMSFQREIIIHVHKSVQLN